MGLISRQAGSPIQDGETASGTEMEAELDTIFNVINGNIENANIAAAADIAGTKLASASVTGSKLSTSTITATQMAAAAMVKAYAATDTAVATVVSTATTYADIPGMSLSLASMTSGDLIFLDFSCRVAGALSPTMAFTFSIDGTNQTDIIFHTVKTTLDQVVVNWYYTATASTHTVKARSRRVSLDGDTLVWGVEPKLIRALVIAQKP